MAGYIEWSKGLASKREVVMMAASLKIDRHEAAGRLMVFWEWCDENIPEEMIDKETGHGVIVLSPVRGDTEKFIDEQVALSGFAKAMERVGWIKHERGSIVLPHYGRHNGSTGKSRNRNTRNQAKRRAAAVVSDVTILSPINSDKKATNTTKHNSRYVSTLVDSLEGVQGEPETKPGYELGFRCLKRFGSEHLDCDSSICALHRSLFREQPSVYGDDEAALRGIIASAIHAKTNGKKTKIGLFKFLICNPSKAELDHDDLTQAADRLKRHRSRIAEHPEQYDQEFIPLCDTRKDSPA